jgi:acyl carrier protein
MTQASIRANHHVVAGDRVRDEIKQIVAEFSNIAAEEIREDHNVFDDLGWDSLDIVECTMEIEEHFDISVPDDLAENIKTVGEIIDGVRQLLEKAGE